jgi:hypothetical protein
MKNIWIVGFLFFIGLAGCNTGTDSKIDLSGEWQFQTDPDDRGVDEKW